MSKPVPCYLFYAGLFVEELSFFPSLGYLGPELYNGAFILIGQRDKSVLNWYQPGHWYRPDGTPFLTEQVPPELRALALLLT